MFHCVLCCWHEHVADCASVCAAQISSVLEQTQQYSHSDYNSLFTAEVSVMTCEKSYTTLTRVCVHANCALRSLLQAPLLSRRQHKPRSQKRTHQRCLQTRPLRTMPLGCSVKSRCASANIQCHCLHIHVCIFMYACAYGAAGRCWRLVRPVQHGAFHCPSFPLILPPTAHSLCLRNCW